MKTATFAFVTLLAATAAHAADAPLPKMSGQVGDFIEFKTSKTVSGTTSDQRMRVTLTQIDGATAGVTAKMLIKGIDPANLPAIPIPGIAAGVGLDPAELPDNAYSKLETEPKVTGTGKETLTVNGKKLECDWVEQTVTLEGGGTKIVTATKYWLSKEVPVTGLVKATVSRTLPGLGEMKTTYDLMEYKKK